MLEPKVRKLHRRVGIFLVWFLALQAVTGLLLSLWDMTGPPQGDLWYPYMAGIHHGWHTGGGVYRIFLALLTAVQGATGVIIFFMIRGRTKKQ